MKRSQLVLSLLVFSLTVFLIGCDQADVSGVDAPEANGSGSAATARPAIGSAMEIEQKQVKLLKKAAEHRPLDESEFGISIIDMNKNDNYSYVFYSYNSSSFVYMFSWEGRNWKLVGKVDDLEELDSIEQYASSSLGAPCEYESRQFRSELGLMNSSNPNSVSGVSCSSSVIARTYTNRDFSSEVTGDRFNASSINFLDSPNPQSWNFDPFAPDPKSWKFFSSNFTMGSRTYSPSVVEWDYSNTTDGAFPDDTGESTEASVQTPLKDANGNFVGAKELRLTYISKDVTPVRPSIMTPRAPENGGDVPSTSASTNVPFQWYRGTNSGDFDQRKIHLQVSRDINFPPSSLVVDDPDIYYLAIGISRSVPSSDTYFWRVRAINEFGEGDWSTVWSFTVLSPPPSPPSTPNLSGTISSGYPLLSWNGVPNATSYEVYQTPLPVGDLYEGILSPTSSTSFLVGGMCVSSVGVSYNNGVYYRVRAKNAQGQVSSWSNTVWYRRCGGGGGF